MQRLLALYRERYLGFNVRHFHQLARREHGVRFCYAFVKKALQTAGLVAKHQPRGRHRRRREPRACFGELLHLDGSRHHWLALCPERWFTLIAVVDDATKRLLYAALQDGGESVAAIMTALRHVLERYGIPIALYTDRAHWAVHTPTSGSAPDPRRPTQVGRALARLGIEHILGYSPQARGRSERANRTLQDRLVNELRVAGITTVAAANRYVGDRFLPAFNAEFGRPPADPALRLRTARARRARSDPLRRGRTHRRARQCRDHRPGPAAAHQTARPPHLRRVCGCWCAVISVASTPSGTAAAASVATTRSASRCGRREPMLFNRAANSRCQTVAANSRISNSACPRLCCPRLLPPHLPPRRALKRARQLPGDVLEIAGAHDVVAVEDGARPVAGHLHGDALRHPGVDHVPDGGPAEVVAERPATPASLQAVAHALRKSQRR